MSISSSSKSSNTGQDGGTKGGEYNTILVAAVQINKINKSGLQTSYQ
jgi:hypothetical protein